MFGVLDSRFAQKYKDDISGIQSNEEHLQLLLRKQTSIIEITLNVVKKDEVEISRQHNFLNEMIHNMSQSQNDSEYFQQLFLTALQMSDECSRLSLLLSQLLESVSNLDAKHINLYIISNQELKSQVPNKNMYSVIQMKPFLTKRNIIFKITIPLLSINKYQIFKTFPVPFKNRNEYVIANNISPYILTSIDFKQYELLDEQKFEKCQDFGESTRICHGPNELKSDRVNGCEWNTLTYQSISDSCEFSSIKIVENFIEFNENKYIYVFSKPKVATVACGHKILPINLGGEGILSMNYDCTLDSENHLITPKRKKQTSIERSWTHGLSPSIVCLQAWSFEPKVMKTLESFEKTEFKPIEEDIKRMKEKDISINKHDVHHYSLIYVLVILIIIAALYLKRKLDTFQMPIPAPR